MPLKSCSLSPPERYIQRVEHDAGGVNTVTSGGKDVGLMSLYKEFDCKVTVATDEFMISGIGREKKTVQYVRGKREREGFGQRYETWFQMWRNDKHRTVFLLVALLRRNMRRSYRRVYVNSMQELQPVLHDGPIQCFPVLCPQFLLDKM